MITFTVKYKSPKSLFWRRLKKVKGDAYDNSVFRLFILENEIQYGLPFNYFFKMGKGRWELLQERKIELPKLNSLPFTVYYKFGFFWHKIENVKSARPLRFHYQFISEDKNGYKIFRQIPLFCKFRFGGDHYISEENEMSNEARQGIRIDKR